MKGGVGFGDPNVLTISLPDETFMKSALRTLLFTATSALAVAACFNDVHVPEEGMGSGRGSGFATLYAKDPLRQSYDFVRSEYGSTIQNNQVVNAGAHISYSSYVDGAFTVGIQGGEQGIILDLGTDDEVAARLGVTETVGGGQGFAALAFRERVFNDSTAQGALTAALHGAAPAPVVDRHVYVLRIQSEGSNTSKELVVKLLVISLTEGRETSFEWVRLL